MSYKWPPKIRLKGTRAALPCRPYGRFRRFTHEWQQRASGTPLISYERGKLCRGLTRRWGFESHVPGFPGACSTPGGKFISHQARGM